VGAYRPIALLNTIRKILEFIIISRLNVLAKKHQFLPEIQIGARPGRSIISVLELLTEQIYIIWKYKNNNGRGKVATILFFNIKNVFDKVLSRRLIYNLIIKNIPRYLRKWAASFI
jgi:hypothetical protein